MPGFIVLAQQKHCLKEGVESTPPPLSIESQKIPAEIGLKLYSYRNSYFLLKENRKLYF